MLLSYLLQQLPQLLQNANVLQQRVTVFVAAVTVMMQQMLLPDLLQRLLYKCNMDLGIPNMWSFWTPCLHVT